jgi:hypothetical protein
MKRASLTITILILLTVQACADRAREARREAPDAGAMVDVGNAEPDDAGGDAEAAFQAPPADGSKSDASAEALIDAGEPIDPIAAWRAAPLFKSGTRLRARVDDGGGEAVALAALHDSTLDVDCTFTLASDGEWRCLPSRILTALYLDENCTQMVVRGDVDWEHDVCQAQSSQLITQAGNVDPVCRERTTSLVYRVGAGLPDGVAFYKDGTGCSSWGTQRCLYEVEEVPASSFVRGELVTRLRSHGLGVDYQVYEDGAEVAATARDTVRDVTCSPYPLGTVQDRCIPSERAHSFNLEFEDSQCQAPVASDVSRSPCAEAAVVVVWEANACGGYTHTLFERGPEVPSAFSPTDAGCQALNGGSGTPAQPPVWYYQIGAPLAPASLPPVESRRLDAGRIALNYYASAEAVPISLRQPVFHDTMLDIDCDALELADGSVRCAPHAYGIDNVSNLGPYADAACSELLAFAPAPPTTCNPPGMFALFVSNSGIASVHVLGAPRALSSVFFLESGVCTSRPTSPGSYFELGEPLDLAAITVRTE